MKPRGLASRFFCARTATVDLSKVPDFRTSNCVGSGCRRWRLGLLRAVRCRTNPNSLMGRIDPFATSSQNDCNLGTGDGRSRRLADIANRPWTSRSSAVQWSPRNGKFSTYRDPTSPLGFFTDAAIAARGDRLVPRSLVQSQISVRPVRRKSRKPMPRHRSVCCRLNKMQ